MQKYYISQNLLCWLCTRQVKVVLGEPWFPICVVTADQSKARILFPWVPVLPYGHNTVTQFPLQPSAELETTPKRFSDHTDRTIFQLLAIHQLAPAVTIRSQRQYCCYWTGCEKFQRYPYCRHISSVVVSFCGPIDPTYKQLQRARSSPKESGYDPKSQGVGSCCGSLWGNVGPLLSCVNPSLLIDQTSNQSIK